ncbi:GAF domain-containing protein [Motiliproteus coralliicola]|uniref:GAF domain-containing protein n=1 Tax=Motiliproteus coralliicola TaxID=2283196 RepID=A0A369WAQ7_9GAMM|nr:GAF domain-containing protein [Motiliproteus coralliicola]RDE18383.1 GAF domain-containing protein [Motiliproteus coralliicola]
MTIDKQQQYDQLFQRLDALCDGESDPIALMATISCELYHQFESFNWVGFYRNVGNRTLKIGPYQGGHGCLTIDFDRGICGRCARQMQLLNIPDVNAEADHIACASSTRSELVAPILNRHGDLIAVLDIDSDTPALFDRCDETNLARIAAYFLI